MSRRKYRFPDRASAEQAYTEADRSRCLAEWFATAILQGRLNQVGTVRDGASTVTIGWFPVTHSYCVYAVSNNTGPHCVRGLWDADGDRLGEVIASMLRYDDSHEFGRLLDESRMSAFRASVAAA